MQTLIENVNIINPFDEVETHQNVLIEDGIIKEISSSRIKAENVIDGEDNYLMAGFIDCHTHIFAKASYYLPRGRIWAVGNYAPYTFG